MIKLLLKILLITTAYFFAIKELIYVIIALTIIDFITGIWKALKNKEPLTSKGYKRTIVKIGAYFTALISCFLLEAEILKTGIYVCRFVAGAISLVEIASIMENLGNITGLKVFNDIFDYIKTRLNTNKNIIDKVIGDEKKDENK